MKKIKAEITTEIIVELDESYFNEAFNENFSRHFSDVDSLEDHAKNIAHQYNRFGHSYLEGYGKPLVNGRKHWSDGGLGEEQPDYNEAINIIDDEDVEIYTYKL